jgi:hypothetical protein
MTHGQHCMADSRGGRGVKTSRIEIGTAVIDMRYENPLYMVERRARPTSSRVHACNLGSAGARPSR